jgi:calpain-7
MCPIFKVSGTSTADSYDLSIAGTYTAIVSTFDSGTVAPFSIRFESDRALGIDAIPAEGAGLYSRVVHGRW